VEWLESFEKEHETKDDSSKKNKETDSVESWFHGSLPIARNTKLDMILMHGPPACGKSTFVKRFLISQGYDWVNRDTLKTPAKCQKAAEQALKAGKSVVIDNTNPDPDSRKPYITLAQKYGASLRGFVMNTSREMAEHLNLFREKLTCGEVPRISSIGYNMFFKKVREGGAPTKSEGFDEIVNIDFHPYFEKDSDRGLFLEFN